MNRKLRLKFLTRLAQTTPAPATPAKPVIPPPPPFQASAMYPAIRKGFNVASVQIIDQLSNLLNTALHYITSGAINFQMLKNNNFIIDASQSPSVDQKNLVNLSQKVYRLLLNSGQDVKSGMTNTQIHNIVDMFRNAPEFNSLSQINPTGFLATKIPGNLKTDINNILLALKNANP